MNAHRIETTLVEDSELLLRNLPFRAGARVEVIILEQETPKTGKDRYPLRGTVLHYDDPTAPIATEDWEALG